MWPAEQRPRRRQTWPRRGVRWRALALVLAALGMAAVPVSGKSGRLSEAQVELSAAKLALWAGELRPALALLEAAAEHDPDHPRIALLGRFTALLVGTEPSPALRHRRRLDRRGETQPLAEAVAALERWVVQGALGAGDLRELFAGYRNFARGRYGAARDILLALVRARPVFGEAHFWLALTRLRRKDAEGALRALAAARGAALAPLVETRVLAAVHAAAEAQRAAAEGVKPPVPKTQPTPGPETGIGGLLAASSASPAAGSDLGPVPPARLAALLAPGLEVVEIRDRPRWDLRFGVAAVADSNPLSVPDGGAARPAGAPTVVGTAGDQALALDLRAEFHPFYAGRGWSLGLAFAGDQTVQNDFGFLDRTRLRGTVQLAWGDDPLGFLLGPFGYTRVPVGHRPVSVLLQAGWTESLLDGDRFERRARLGIGLALRSARRTATQIDLSYVDRAIVDDGLGAFERSGDSLAVRVSQFLYLGRRDRNLRLGIEVGSDDAGAAFAADHRETSIELAWPLNDRLALYVVTAERVLSFDQRESHPLFPSFLADRPREDTERRARVALVWRLDPHLRLVLRGGFFDRNVDLGAAAGVIVRDAERTVAGIGLTWLF